MKNYIILCVLLAIVGCGKHHDAEADRKYSKISAEGKERFERWAYIAKEKQISKTETIKLLIIPDPMGIGLAGGDMFDTKCLIYSNSEYKTSQMICPDADRNKISEPSDAATYPDSSDIRAK